MEINEWLRSFLPKGDLPEGKFDFKSWGRNVGIAFKADPKKYTIPNVYDTVYRLIHHKNWETPSFCHESWEDFVVEFDDAVACSLVF